MAASVAQLGAGTTLGYAAFPTPSGYTTCLEVSKVGIPKVTYDEVKVTHYLSANNLHEFIAGWGNGNEVQVEANYVKAEMTSLTAIQGVLKTWKITLPDTSTWIFGGFVKEVDGEIPNEDKIMTKFTIKVTGKPTFTAAA